MYYGFDYYILKTENCYLFVNEPAGNVSFILIWIASVWCLLKFHYSRTHLLFATFNIRLQRLYTSWECTEPNQIYWPSSKLASHYFQGIVVFACDIGHDLVRFVCTYRLKILCENFGTSDFVHLPNSSIFVFYYILQIMFQSSSYKLAVN